MNMSWGPKLQSLVLITTWWRFLLLCLLLLLTAVGPLLAWRKTSLDSLKRNFLWPAMRSCGCRHLMVAIGSASLERRLILICARGGHAGHAGHADGGF